MPPRAARAGVPESGLMSERPSAPQPQGQAAWFIVAALVGVVLASLLSMGLLFFRPIRVSGGRWVLTRTSAVTWPDGRSSRDFVRGGDWLVRRDWDWDRDGAYDCREDYCDWKSTKRWAACVSYFHEGQWVPAPSEVLDCESFYAGHHTRGAGDSL